MRKTLLFICLILIFSACNNNEDGKIYYIDNQCDKCCEINILNYLGNTENIHPKVLYFANGLWGYKYWMAYTPYPSGETDAENPCIAVSNDGINWIVPNGLVNPLAFPPKNSNGGYNSDTHLIYRDDIKTLECWYRVVKLQPSRDAIVRKTTTNGIDWRTEEIAINYGTYYKLILSPAVIFENGKYKMWYCHNNNVLYSETTNSTIKNWTNPVVLPIDWGSLSAWHLDVINNGIDGYEMVVCAYQQGGNNNTADLYYIKQFYTGEFTKPILILGRSSNIKSINYQSIYRSSLVKVGTAYYLYYSCIDKHWHRHMALCSGKIY